MALGHLALVCLSLGNGHLAMGHFVLGKLALGHSALGNFAMTHLALGSRGRNFTEENEIANKIK